MKIQFSNRLRLLALSLVLAGLNSGCFLFHTHSGYAPVHQYAKDGDAAKVAAELDKHGWLANQGDDAGLTPLHYAALHCHTNVVALLLKRGADVNRAAKDATTPLHVAAQEGCGDAVQMLLAKHAKINARDTEDRTPLKRAELWHQDAVADLLRARGGSE